MENVEKFQSPYFTLLFLKKEGSIACGKNMYKNNGKWITFFHRINVKKTVLTLWKSCADSRGRLSLRKINSMNLLRL